MAAKTFDAETINLSEVLEFIDSILEGSGCPMKTQLQIDVAAEEIFVNVAHYAYKPDIGPVEVRIETTDAPKGASITFIDSGKPYNPLEMPDPDINIPIEDRQEGGLGIFMVKKSMDDVSYEFVNGQNRLTIKKNF